MTDKDFLKAVKAIKGELHRRYGTKVCKELDINCGDCKVRIMVGILNDQISFLDWCVRNKKNEKGGTRQISARTPKGTSD